MSTDNNTDPNTDPEHMQRLRAAADENPQLRQQNADKDREIAFLKAGVNTGSTFGAMVMQKHGADTEITTESVKAIVDELNAELGIGEEPAEEPGTDPNSPEGQLAQTQQQLTGGAPAPQEQPKAKPFDERAMTTMHDARTKGATKLEAQEAGIGEIIRAAANGEAGAVYDEDAWFAERSEAGHGAEFAGLQERSYEVNVNNTPKANV